MGDLSRELEHLELTESIFQNVKFYITGQAPDKIGDLLKSGGAERMNYFSDYVTHLICGMEPEDGDITDATDLYEIPAVSCKWALMCAKVKRLVDTKPYLQVKRIFTGLRFCLQYNSKGRDREDRNTLWAIITFHGGLVQLNLSATCQYLVTVECSGSKYQRTSEYMISVVTPDWIIDSVRNNALADVLLFHPRLITWPRPSATAAITGFIQDSSADRLVGVGEAAQRIQQQQAQHLVADDSNNSTQALLDKLKSRMPWNQQQQVAVTVSDSSQQDHQLQQHQQQQQQQQQQQHVLSIASSSITATSAHLLYQPQQQLLQQHSAATTSVASVQQLMQQQQQHQGANGGATTAAGAASINRILEQLQQSQQQQQQRLTQQSPITPGTAGHAPMQQQQQQHFLQQQQRLRSPQQLTPIGVGIQQQQQQQQQQRLPISPQQQQHIQMQRQLQLQQQLRPVQQAQQGGPVAGPGQQLIQQRMHLQTQRAMHTLQQTAVQVAVPDGNIINQQVEQGAQQHQQLQQMQYSNQQSPLVESQRYNMLLSPQQQQPVQSQLVNQTTAAAGPSYLQQQQQQQQQQFVALQQQQQQQQPFNTNANNSNFSSPQQQQQFVPQQQQSRMIGLQPQQQQFNQAQQQQRQWPLQQQVRLSVQGQQQLPVQQPQQPQHQVQQRAWLPPPPPPPPQPLTSTSVGVLPPPQQQQQQQRQLIHLDAQTHQQLQQMAPEQRAMFVAKIQKQRHIMHLQQQRLIQQQQQQQRGPLQQHVPTAAVPVGPGHIVIRSSNAPNLQQHWAQQQQNKLTSTVTGLPSAPQAATVLQQPPLLAQTQQQQQTIVVTGQPQPNAAVVEQQLQLRQHQYRLQQLQAQREQTQLKLQQQMPPQQQQQPVAAVDVMVVNQHQQQPGPPQPLVVNPKTKTALANMLSNRLHGSGQQVQQLQQHSTSDMAAVGGDNHMAAHLHLLPQQPVQQPSAASTLKLLTANHNAQLQNVAPPPSPSPHHTHAHMHSHTPPTHLLHQQQQQQQQRKQQPGSVTSIGVGVVTAGRAPPPTVVQSPSSASLAVGVLPTQQSAGQQQQHQHQQPGSRLQQVTGGPGPFYGHNPNLKLPAELFLLGCIFVCVEIGADLDASVSNWRQRIERHGGELEAQYCARVTHVLCRTQRHGVVMQALRDYKRCVTAYWLADTLLKRKVEPPSAALHLPAATLDSQPGARHLVALSGFAGTDRDRIKHMIALTGAQYTNYFSRHNSVLVAARPDGPKFTHARKWNTPVVSVHWLTDVLLGQCGPALAQLDHAKYQHWPTITTPNDQSPAKSGIFAFDAGLVPTLMQAWKMPINISQESYERVKRSSALQQQQAQQNTSLPPPSIRPPKRPRLDSSLVDNLTTIATATATADADIANNECSTHRILFSTCTNLQEMRAAVATLGGACARSHRDATHLVMSYLSRTNKLLLAVARGLHVVSDRWIRDSLQAGKFLQDTANNYSLDPRDFNLEYKCDFGAVMRSASPAARARLFAGRTFFLTPSLFPRRHIVAELVQSGGGTVERVRRTAAQIEAAHAHAPQSYVIVTHAQDLHLVADLLGGSGAKSKGRPGAAHVTRSLVCNVELVLTAVLRQTFEVEPYSVKVM